jgi:predicted membrane-bound spermidine synthase
MLQDLRAALRIAAAMLVLAEVLALTRIVSGPLEQLAGTLDSEHWVFNLGSMGLHAFLLYTAYHAPDWRRPLWTLLGGLALDVFLLRFLPDTAPDRNHYYWICVLAAGPGLVAFAQIAVESLRGFGERREHQRALLGTLLLLEIYGLGLGAYLELTAALHPATFDAAAYRIDAAYGFSPSVTVALLTREIPGARAVLELAYHVLPYGFSVLCALQLRSGLRWPANVFLITTVSGAIVLVLYQLCPIAGPGYAFADAFPYSMQAAEQYTLGAAQAPVAPRNGMPSMHFGWALLLWFNARSLHPFLRAAFALLLGLTFLATLGLGEHYLVDLVAGIPAALAIQAVCTRTLPWSHPARRQAIWGGFALALMWSLGVRYAGSALAGVPGLLWALTLLTLVWSAACYARLGRAWPPQPALLPDSLPARAARPRRGLHVAVAMFFVSGFAGLMYQVLFSKSLALTFGSTSTATYTVLATYMGGMALGAWLGGLLTEGRRDVLRLYGWCELGIGLFCLATPVVFSAIQALYVASASGLPPDAGVLTVLRIALGALSLAVPTILMGMTLPLLARFIGEGGGSLGVPVAILYGANTLGAAFGALLAGYSIIPLLGLSKSTMLAAVANLAVALLALRMQKSWLAPEAAPAAPRHAAPAQASVQLRAQGRLALVLLAAGGFVTLALEVNYIHLLAVVAGNSVYAFSLMLFAFLLGLGAGAEAGRRLIAARVPTVLALGLLEFGLAGVVLAGVFMWNGLPEYFASFAGYGLTQNFSSREFVRGIVCWIAMFPAAFFIGALYPVAMEAVGLAYPAQRYAALGRAAALNTAGNIAGVLTAGFLMLPVLGALRSVQALAALSLALGVAAIALSPWRGSARAWLPAVAVLGLFAAQPASFDYSALASGANVYFQRQGYGRVIDHAESVDGGLTTVAQARRDDGPVLTLLTNGKFQGSNDVRGEMPAQVGFAVAPLLHTAARERALVIGYGTGVSARTLNDAGFKAVDVVDLSADIVRMADRHFGAVNGGVTRRPGVELFVTDGRNFLMLQERKYDVVSMEISSIWFAGAASLYNREFYQLVKRRLQPSGVLQQWMQLHHIAPVDMLNILGSVRSEFSQVWLYFIGDQGIIVASNDAARAPSREAFARLERTASFQALMQILRGYSGDLFDTLVLDPAGTDAFIASFGLPQARWISTDDNLFLEYHTPQGNALDGQQSLRDNLALLKRYGPRARGG